MKRYAKMGNDYVVGDYSPDGGAFVTQGPASPQDAVPHLVKDYLGGELKPVDPSGKLLGQRTIDEAFFNRVIQPTYQQDMRNGTLRQSSQVIRGLIGDDPKIIRLVREHDGLAVARQIWGDKAVRSQKSRAPPPEPTPVPADVIEGSEAGQGVGPPPAASPPEPDSPPATSSPPEKTGGDPVILFSGQFMHQVTDLEASGRGLAFRLVRTYMQQAVYKGPLGYGWDHSYNLWLREEREVRPAGGEDNVVYRSNGKVRQERYVQDTSAVAGPVTELSQLADAEFITPDGAFDRLIKFNGRYHLATVAGVSVHYNTDLQVEQIDDLNGNKVTLDYDADRRLTLVTDPVGKQFSFHYDALNRVVQVRDHEGKRSVVYTYGQNGDLEGVDRWPDGEAPSETDYEYSGPDLPADLQHNLVRIINPLGHVVLETEYGLDEDAWSYNRVIRQISEGGEFLYEYLPVFDASLSGVDPALDPVNFPVFCTIVTSPRGHQVTHQFNRQGNPVFRMETIEVNGLPQPVTALSFYNEDGCLIREVAADGAVVTYLNGREAFAALHGGDASSATPEDRRAFGLVHRRIQGPRPGLGDMRSIVVDRTYTDYGRIRTERGPYFVNAGGLELPGQTIEFKEFVYDANGNLVRLLHPALTTAGGGAGAFIQPPHVFDYDGHGMLMRAQVGGAATDYRYFPDLLRSGFIQTKIEDSAGVGRVTTYNADGLGRILEVRSDWGTVESYTYNGFDLVVTETRTAPDGPPATLRHDYNVARQLLRSTEQIADSAGNSTADSPLVRTLTRDRYGRVIAERLEGRISPPRAERRVLGVDGQVERHFDALGIETRYVRNALGQIVETRVANGRPEMVRRRSAYAVDGQQSRAIDGMGAVSDSTFDAFGRIRRTVDRDGNVVERDYDAAGRLIQERLSGPLPGQGVVRWSETRFEHDELGRVIRTLSDLFEPGAATPGRVVANQVAYDVIGHVAERRDASGALWRSHYDGLGREVLRTDPDATERSWRYDDVKRAAELTTVSTGLDAAGQPADYVTRVTTELDSRGQVIRIEDAAGNIETRSYDSQGRLVVRTDAAGSAITFHRNVFGEETGQLQTLNGQPILTTFAYDLAGRRTELTDPNQNVVRWNYDGLGYVTQITRGARIHRLRHDAEARLFEETDENGVVVRRTYTGEGRLRTVVPDLTGYTPPPQAPGYLVAATAGQSFAYSPKGQVLEAREGATVILRRYDSLGRLLAEDIDGLQVGLAYDDAGRCTQVTYPDGRRVTYAYSPAGHLMSADQVAIGAAYPGDPLAPAARRLASVRAIGDRVTAIDFPAASVTLGYDAALRPVSADWMGPPGGAVRFAERRLYGPRDECRLDQADSRVRTTQFDDLGRQVQSDDLTSAQLAATGVLKPARRIADLTATGQVDEDNVAAPPGPATGQLSYGLDANTNRTQVTTTQPLQPPVVDVYSAGPYDTYKAIGPNAVTYDSTGATIAHGARSFRFDALGRLVEAGPAASSTRLSYDALGRVRHLVGPGGTQDLVHAGDALLEWRAGAQVLGQVVPFGRRIAQFAASGLDLVPVNDLEGSLVGLIAADGSLSGKSRYDPFGQVLERTPGWALPLGYRGYWEDQNSGLNLLPARAYDPVTGRFLTEDPQGFLDGSNMYAYARHAPATYTDQWGFESEHHDWGQIAKTAITTIGMGAGVLAVGGLLILAGASAPFLATLGGIALVKSGLDSFLRRANDALDAGVTDATGRAAFAAVLDVAPIPLGRAMDLATGRDMVTGRKLSMHELDTAWGEVVAGAAMFGGGKALTKLGGPHAPPAQSGTPLERYRAALALPPGPDRGRQVEAAIRSLGQTTRRRKTQGLGDRVTDSSGNGFLNFSNKPIDLEIKTYAKPVRFSPRVQLELAKDIVLRATTDHNPIWVFTDAGPGRSLAKALSTFGVEVQLWK